ncbi:MAG: T9SS type A sorting domain-containing protein [Candidatus Krumholzibacteriia bacterium]
MFRTRPLSSAGFMVTLGLATLGFAVPATLVGDARAAVLYDVDFGSPPHTIGSLPVTGTGPAPRITVSSIPYGDPTVLANFGDLQAQPCWFDSHDGTGDQIALDLTDLPASTFYQLTCRIQVGLVEPTGNFTVFLDTPAIRAIAFNAANEVRVQVGGTSTVVANYVTNVAMDLRVDVDLSADTWRIYLDGAPVHVGSFGGAAAVEQVRFSTNAAADPPGVSAAIDDVVVADEPQPAAIDCERLDFEDLPAAYYFNGNAFVTGSVRVVVSPLYLSSGACDEPTTSNFATVTTNLEACGSGQELDLVNVNLEFEFGSPVTDVVVPFGEYSGIINLSINEDCRALPDLAVLDGITVGGVDVAVMHRGFPGQSCGILTLRGEVHQLSLGGQDLAIDNLSFCRGCPAPAVALFEELAPGATYTSGQAFSSGFGDFEVQAFLATFGCADPISGTAEVSNAGAACGSGQEIHLTNAGLAVTSSLAPYGAVVVDYAEYDGLVNLTVNGACMTIAHFANVNGMEVGGAHVFAIDHDAPSGGCGRLYVVGTIDTFAVGGAELWIDDVRVCSTAAALVDVPGGLPAAVRSVLEQNVPNPFNPATTIAFELPSAGTVRLAVYDLAGRQLAVLVDEPLSAGRHEVRWDGVDGQGRRSASGVYLYRLETSGRTEVRRMVMLK